MKSAMFGCIFQNLNYKNKLDGKISDYLNKIFPEICGSLERNLK